MHRAASLTISLLVNCFVGAGFTRTVGLSATVLSLDLLTDLMSTALLPPISIPPSPPTNSPFQLSPSPLPSSGASRSACSKSSSLASSSASASSSSSSPSSRSQARSRRATTSTCSGLSSGSRLKHPWPSSWCQSRASARCWVCGRRGSAQGARIGGRG